MNKPLFIISAPMDTYSGYGARSRDIIKAIIATDKFDVKLLSQRWGNTRFGYLADHNEDIMQSLIIPKVDTKPEHWMQITVPNEFQKVGTYNIGCTAGMETTQVAPEWLQGVNRMDVVITSSKHSKNVFEQTVYDMKNNTTGATEQLSCQTPIEVIFEGVDTEKYFKKVSTLNLDLIKEQFCYLVVGQWMPGVMGQDRKNIPYTIKTFLETFKNKMGSAPALLLKTTSTNTSIMGEKRMLEQIDAIRKTVKGKLPNVYLLNGDLSDQEMNELYNHSKVKVMVSHTKGEGFGRPLLEFTTTGKPIIASAWSGQADFLDSNKSILLGGDLNNVDKSAAVKGMILEEAKWFTPNDAEVHKAYKETFKHLKNALAGAKQQKSRTLKEFKLSDMFVVVDEFITRNLPAPVVMTALKLPELPKL